MTTEPRARLTPEEYLARERAAQSKSEYFAGEVFARAGASRAHNLIVGNWVAELRARLQGKPCEVYPSDMRIKVEASGLYTYPDVSVVCGPPSFLDRALDTLLNALVLIEVLSESSEAYDRGKKFEHFRRIPTLREYVLAAQDRRHVEVFSRSETGFWVLSEASAGDVPLASIGCSVPLDEVYARVDAATA